MRVTDLRLTNTTFCVIFVRMTHCKAHMVVTLIVRFERIQKGNLVGVFFPRPIKRQNGECYVRNYVLR